MTAPAPPSSGLGPGIVALIAVDAVLVLTFVVLALSLVLRGGADPETDASPGGTPTAEATGSPGPSSPVAEDPAMEEFALPSGNIACTMGAERVRCSIASFTFEPPAVEGCTGTVGHVIELTATGAQFTCETGAPPGQAGEGVPVLGYGEQTTVSGFTCSSSTAGVLCRNPAGAGFTLARAGFDLFE